MARKVDCGCCERVVAANSARLFRNPAPVLRHPVVQALFRSQRGAKVIEIGGGCLRNVLFLQKRGFAVCVVELKEVQTKFASAYANFRSGGGRVFPKIPTAGKFDIAVATFVIETLCDPKGRAALVSAVSKLLVRRGCMVVSVRGPADLLTAKNAGLACSDGYLTPNRTFARSYTRPQLGRFLRACGFGRLQFLHKAETEAPKLLHLLAWKE